MLTFWNIFTNRIILFVLLTSTLREAYNNTLSKVEICAFSGLNYGGPHCKTRAGLFGPILLDEIFRKLLYYWKKFGCTVQVSPFPFLECISWSYLQLLSVMLKMLLRLQRMSFSSCNWAYLIFMDISNLTFVVCMKIYPFSILFPCR